ncbi:MAG: hypothetical protein IPK00_25365 [Deltaproteobacteria bacterium]|nr:hypothetical protein [Deltaproteobacteria bacterium]
MPGQGDRNAELPRLPLEGGSAAEAWFGDALPGLRAALRIALVEAIRAAWVETT